MGPLFPRRLTPSLSLSSGEGDAMSELLIPSLRRALELSFKQLSDPPAALQVTFPESRQMRAESIYFPRFQKNMPFPPF